MYAIKTKNLTKQYKDVCAVDALDLTVEGGEIFALLGVNGAGKTTAIKMLSCLTAPTSGDAEVFGMNILKDAGCIKQIIALSPQDTAIAPNLSVKENLELIAGIHGSKKTDAEECITELSKLLGLDQIIEWRAGKLSGGWQRRLSIAMALISRPRLLFLDEPTLGLDVLARSELWDIIRSLKGKTTVILTTHYMEEAEALSDRIGIMKNGKLLTTGTAEELMKITGTTKFEDAFIAIVREGKA